MSCSVGLDIDLREGLAQSLVAQWTHTSTALEGNTINAGDTLFVLTEGMTIQGKSLREHQELHGHAQALSILSSWVGGRQSVRVEALHELHRAVQTGSVVDSLAPVGAWKVEQNGTMAITSTGSTKWHEYARPADISSLMAEYLKQLSAQLQTAGKMPQLKAEDFSNDCATGQLLIEAYTDVHLSFTGIHPYADGNGRLARLLANMPILRAGFPPLLISPVNRRSYIQLMGDYSLKLGQPKLEGKLVYKGAERDALRDFFAREWQSTLITVKEFHTTQKERGEHNRKK